MEKKFWLKGVIPALVTPFERNFEVDEESLRRLVDFVIEKGVTGVVPCGTTGEFVNMTVEERMKVIEVTIDEVNGRVPVIAGTGDARTTNAIEFTKHAEDAGATAALVVSPFYFKPTDKEIYEHYDKIAEAADLPIILYNIPQVTGVEIPWWVVEGLSEIDNIVGIKDSSGNMPYMMALFEKVYGKISIICGHDEIAVAALAAGADGLILASANLIPDLWLRLYDLVEKHDLEEARSLQRKVQTLARIITRHGGGLAVKAGLRMMELDVGTARKPLMTGGVFRYEDEELLRLSLEWLGKLSSKTLQLEIKPNLVTKSMFAGATPQTPMKIRDFSLKVGEAFASPSTAEVAHVDLLIGLRNGPVGRTFRETLANPRTGHDPQLVRLGSKTVKPDTLLVPTVTIRTERQAEFVYVHAMSGVAKAVVDSVEDGLLPKDALEELVMIANVFVHPTASNPKRVMINNFKAMVWAIRRALEARPTSEELMERKESARHPFRYEP
ncbi:MAG: 4-hydroxy-tetrahydrodipicolinate synthase [Candidatus Bathyarchaeota archaeon]|nr:4-hydroxy-tetrahydrodipicolinate synthase [Candidatus Bathyarchaeota archaeon]MDH5732634.1 4-hydroxy-tetrahydrodipicolinate synthase [Candidatus Bathyarchaeota archaeon]